MGEFLYPYIDFIQIPVGEARFFNLHMNKISEEVRFSILHKEYYRVTKLTSAPEYLVELCSVELGKSEILSKFRLSPTNGIYADENV